MSETPKNLQGEKVVTFTLDGREVEAREGETIWQVAKREGIDDPASVLLARARLSRRRQLPRLHGRDRGRARAGGMLHPQAGRWHEGQVSNQRAETARKMVFELLVSDQPERETSHDPASKFWDWADKMGIEAGRFPEREKMPAPDRSHPAMAVNLDACIQCNLCVRACREVQVNDVIGMACRGHDEKIVFDFDDPMGKSTCVACGECVQACPTGALMPSSLVERGQRAHRISRQAGRLGLSLLRRRLPAHLQHQGRQAALCHRQGRPGEREPAVREGPLRLRLCAQSAAPDEAADPQGGRAESPARIHRSGQSVDAFPRSDLGRGARYGGAGLPENPRAARPEGARRLRLGQVLERGGLSVPEADPHRLRHQQRRSLHAAVPCLVGRGAARRRRLGRGDGDLQRGEEFRRHHRHRRQPDREPSGRRDLSSSRRPSAAPS